MKRIAILFFSFIVLVGCQADKEGGLVRTPGDPLGTTVQSPFTTMIENAHQPDPILGRVYFQYDNAELLEGSRAQLDQIVKQVSRRDGLVVVEGYADHMNTDEFNIRLGYERALTVAKYLRSEGVWDERLVVQSFGEARPITTNWKDLGRALNRCVVVRMYAQGEGMSGKDAVKVYRGMANSAAANSAPVVGSVPAALPEPSVTMQ